MYTLRAKNFQRYKNVQMGIDNFTVLEGPSSLGKSAIVRAIEVATKNSWSASYVTQGQKSTSIQLTSDDFDIQVAKGNKNSFIIKTDKGLKEYSKAGKDVPSEILDLGFSPLVTGSDNKIDLMLSGQYDPLFMVSYSDMLNTNILNSVFGISKLEKANSLVIKDISVAKKELQRNVKDIEYKNKELNRNKELQEQFLVIKDKYSNAEDIGSYHGLKNDYIKVKGSLSDLKSLQANYDKLRELRDSIHLISDFIDVCRDIDNLKPKLDKATNKVKAIEILDGLYSILDYNDVDLDIIRVGMDLDSLKSKTAHYKQSDDLLQDIYLVSDFVAINEDIYKMTTSISLKKATLDLALLQDYLLKSDLLKVKRNAITGIYGSVKQIESEISNIGYCPCCNQKIGVHK